VSSGPETGGALFLVDAPPQYNKNAKVSHQKTKQLIEWNVTILSGLLQKGQEARKQTEAIFQGWGKK
jgi:hypothetical protein